MGWIRDGVGYTEEGKTGNFEGNCYIARTDYIATLPDLKQHQVAMRHVVVEGCEGERLACQTWHALNAGKFISLVCSNERIWEFETVSKYI